MDGKKQAKKRRRNLTKEKQSPGPISRRKHNRVGEEVKISPTISDLKQDTAVWDLYNRWCLHYNIHRTAEEMNERFHIFKKNAIHVSKLNLMEPSYQFHLSSFCDEKDLFDPPSDEDEDEDEEVSLTPTQQDLESDKAVWDLYYRWCLHHEILRTPEEMQQRFNIFKTSACYTVKRNQKDPSSCHFPLPDWCDKIEPRCSSSGVEEMRLTPTKGDLESDEALMELYRRWCFHHKIKRTPEEMKLGLRSFGKIARQAFEMSQKDPTVQFCLSIWCDETDYHPVWEVTFIPTGRDLESGNALLGLYHRCCHRYWVYRTPEEMQQRFQEFKKNAVHVFERNKNDSTRLFFLPPCCDEQGEEGEEAAACVRIRPTFRDLASRDAVMALYKRWCLTQNISRTPEEMDERLPFFKEMAQDVFDCNFENPGTCAMGWGSDENINWASSAFKESDDDE